MIGASHILVLIGLPGVGKTTVARIVADRLDATLIEMDRYRQEAASAAVIADDLASHASCGPVVFECSGASGDFEFILRGLEERGVTCFVAGLFALTATVLRRLELRVPQTAPKAGGGWLEHVKWVETRLRLVPTDLEVDAECLEPADVASAVIAAWESHVNTAPSLLPDTFDHQDYITFSQLANRQVCPREFAYRYVWRTPPTIEAPEILDVGQAAHEALARLFAPEAARPTLAAFLSWYDARLPRGESCDSNAADLQPWARQLLADFYARHFLADDRRTIAVELDVSFRLDGALSFVGRLDRLALTPIGELEVTEFKLKPSRPGSRPRIPELLQPAAYAVGVMASRQAPRAFVQLHFLEQNLIERVMLVERDAESIRLAMLRWIRSLRRRGYDARPGYHCRHCRYRTVCPSSQFPNI